MLVSVSSSGEMKIWSIKTSRCRKVDLLLSSSPPLLLSSSPPPFPSRLAYFSRALPSPCSHRPSLPLLSLDHFSSHLSETSSSRRASDGNRAAARKQPILHSLLRRQHQAMAGEVRGGTRRGRPARRSCWQAPCRPCRPLTACAVTLSPISCMRLARVRQQECLVASAGSQVSCRYCCVWLRGGTGSLH